MVEIAAQVFAVMTCIVVLFQLALTAGAPWGHLAMGGRYPGKFPAPMRIAALVQGCVLAALGWVVLVRGQVIDSNLYDLSSIGIWVVVALMGVSVVMHLFTPSRWERIVWLPVVAVLFICSLTAALS